MERMTGEATKGSNTPQSGVRKGTDWFFSPNYSFPCVPLPPPPLLPLLATSHMAHCLHHYQLFSISYEDCLKYKTVLAVLKIPFSTYDSIEVNKKTCDPNNEQFLSIRT